MKRKTVEPDKDLSVCLRQMPDDMKQRVIAYVESELGMTIPEYKTMQIAAGYELVADIKLNPVDYTTVVFNQKVAATVGNFDIPEELEKELELARLFIGYRTSTKYETDGTIEKHPDASYDDFIRDRINPYRSEQGI